MNASHLTQSGKQTACLEEKAPLYRPIWFLNLQTYKHDYTVTVGMICPFLVQRQALFFYRWLFMDFLLFQFMDFLLGPLFLMGKIKV